MRRASDRFDRMAVKLDQFLSVPSTAAEFSANPIEASQGEPTSDLFTFLTTDANTESGALHPKAMRVILRTAEEVDAWMTTTPADVMTLQRPLPDGSLTIVARGAKQDPPAVASEKAPALLF